MWGKDGNNCHDGLILKKEEIAMPTRNVHLTEHYDSFIAAGIEDGRYSNASEAVRAGLRLLEQREQEDRAKIEWLRGATQDAFAAFDRGEGVALNPAGGINGFVGEIVAEARAGRTAPRA
jgi:antitoxin ParD1/3/4